MKKQIGKIVQIAAIDDGSIYALDEHGQIFVHSCFMDVNEQYQWRKIATPLPGNTSHMD